MKINATMIVKNEEKRIRRCLESIDGKVDEILIYDTGSEDKTVELIYSLQQFMVSKVHIYICPEKKKFNFSEARNHVLSLSDADYNVIIDADEIIETEREKPFHDIVDNMDVNGVAFPFVNKDNFTPPGEKPNFIITSSCATNARLVKKGFVFEGRVHNQIPNLQNLTYVNSVKFVHFGIDYSDDESIAHREMRKIQTRDLLKDVLFDEKTTEKEKELKWMYWYELGVLNMQMEVDDVLLHNPVYCFKNALKRMPDDTFKCQAYVYIARIMLEKKKMEHMYSYVKKALQYEDHPDAHYMLMINAIEQKNPKLAMEEMTRFLLACDNFFKNPTQKRSRYLSEKKEIENLHRQAYMTRSKHIDKIIASKERG